MQQFSSQLEKEETSLSDTPVIPPTQPAPATADRSLPKSFWRRTLLSVILVIVVVVFGVAASGFIVSLSEPPTRTEPVSRINTVQTFKTESMTVQEMITGFGTARAMQSVVLSAQVAGEIVETIEPLKIGQNIAAQTTTVTAAGNSQPVSGDVIVKIDPRTYQERLDQSEDLLLEDRAELERLAQEEKNLRQRLKIQERSFTEFQKEYDRVKGLVEQGVLSASNLTTAELDLQRYEDAKVQLETEVNLMPVRIKQTQARMKTRQNEFQLAQLDLQRTEVTSPINGQFSEIHVEQGQYVRVGDPLVTVTNADRVEIPIGIPYQDYLKIIPRIRSGDFPAATLRTNRNSSFEWEGVVTRAAPTADAQTRTVEIYIVLDNDEFDSPLLPGTFVTVSIEGPIYEDVIPIPRDTMYQDQIFVVEDGTVRQKQIDQIATIESILLVKQSLQAGEQVVMTNLDILQDGDPVKVSDEGVQSLKNELLRLRLPTLRILSRESDSVSP